MKVIMKQVLDLIIAKIYNDIDDEEDASKDVDKHLQNFESDRKKRKAAEM